MSAVKALDARAARGAKRVCQACEVRFYDLLREPIVCPACGAHYTPTNADLGIATVAAKPRWRRDLKRSEPALVVAGPEREEPPDVAADEELDVGADDAKDAVVPDDDSIPEEVQEDTDVAGLIEIDEGKDGE